jgi:hypothetical protein
MGKKVKVLEIAPEEYELTLDLTDAETFSIKDAMAEIKRVEEELLKNKKKKK